MRKSARLTAAAAVLLLLGAGALASPALVRGYWSWRDANPVRRGIARAAELGCFTCHGPRGERGIPDPGIEEGEVPAWSGGVWMMYLEGAGEIREFILDGVSRARARSLSAQAERADAAIQMPAFREALSGTDLEDLVAAFQVLSGMSRPPRGTPAWRGQEVARRWRCFECHGAAGSGGVANPGSLAGFIPGWYGPAFDDLVRGREEFDAWVRDGWIDRLARNRIASWFTERQRVKMPPYPDLTPEERDDLWAYVRWLGEHGGADGGGSGTPPEARP
jgi:mono/diheme cytochrome c family protein